MCWGTGCCVLGEGGCVLLTRRPCLSTAPGQVWRHVQDGAPSGRLHTPGPTHWLREALALSGWRPPGLTWAPPGDRGSAPDCTRWGLSAGPRPLRSLVLFIGVASERPGHRPSEAEFLFLLNPKNSQLKVESNQKPQMQSWGAGPAPGCCSEETRPEGRLGTRPGWAPAPGGHQDGV